MIEWWIYLLIVVLQLLSAFFNGTNIGLMGLDPRYLELMQQGPFETKEDEKNSYYAKKILPLRNKGNQLLTTILIGCAATNSIISVLMAEIEGDISGFLISTAIITVFGEILPQAIANKYSLEISTWLRFPMWFFYYATFIVTYPIGAILDKVLGEEAGNTLSKNQMKRMFEQYEKQALIKPQERKILSAVLELKTKSIGQVMTPIEKAFMIDINSNLNQQLLKQIYSEGYSRIPVYEGDRENIVGLLMTRDLILINIEDQIMTLKQLSSILVRDVIAIDVNTKLEPVLTYFKQNKTHMGLVTQSNKQIGSQMTLQKIGIVTIEDIVEEILQEEIEDERENENIKGERKTMKNQIIYLFTDNKAKDQLNDAEIIAICEFLQLKVDNFGGGNITKDQLYKLIRNSDVVDIESDSNPFSHILNENISYTRKPLTYINEYQNQDQLDFNQHLHKKETNGLLESHRKNKSNGSSVKTEANLLDNEQYTDRDQIILKFDQQKGSSNIMKNKDSNHNSNSKLNITNNTPYEDEDVPEEDLGHDQSMSRDGILEDKLANQLDPILFVKGVPADDFYLILQGEVLVCSGSEGFFVKMGSYDYLGLNALVQENYKPDFSAKVLNNARLLRIRYDHYQKYSKVFRQQNLL